MSGGTCENRFITAGEASAPKQGGWKENRHSSVQPDFTPSLLSLVRAALDKPFISALGGNSQEEGQEGLKQFAPFHSDSTLTLALVNCHV